jgi:FlaA1/EpsC-like NDP-sugar epimerase
MSGQSKTQFITVRFGNVLGSNGSMIPLFQKQINNGGPVTVTHPDMNRFFMLIPEAVQLILQAGAFGYSGDIFILEMGKPVKIADLAEKMIRLAGYTPNSEIKIEYIGIRPGEKLSEEIIDVGENIFPTPHEKIKLLKSHEVQSKNFVEKIDSLCQKTTQLEPLKLRHALFELMTTDFPPDEKKPPQVDSNQEANKNKIN